MSLLRDSPPSPEERKNKKPRVQDHYVEDIMDIFKEFKLNETKMSDDFNIEDLVKKFSKIKTRNFKDRELKSLLKSSYVTEVMSDISKIKSEKRVTRSVVKAAKAFESFMDVNAGKASTSKASTSKASTSKATTKSTKSTKSKEPKASTSRALVPIKEEPDSPEEAFVHFYRKVKNIKKEPKEPKDDDDINDLFKNLNMKDKMEEGGSAKLTGALAGGVYDSASSTRSRRSRSSSSVSAESYVSGSTASVFSSPASPVRSLPKSETQSPPKKPLPRKARKLPPMYSK
jgi:hypothetical protein